MSKKSSYFKYLLFFLLEYRVTIQVKREWREKVENKDSPFRLAQNVCGFTLIEVIVVIAILGALTALALPRFIGVLANSQEKTDLANVHIVQSAVELYEAEKGEIPSTIATFDGLVTELNAKGYLKNTEIKPVSKNKVFSYDKSTQTVSLK